MKKKYSRKLIITGKIFPGKKYLTGNIKIKCEQKQID
jgi:hypothetical protein